MANVIHVMIGGREYTRCVYQDGSKAYFTTMRRPTASGGKDTQRRLIDGGPMSKKIDKTIDTQRAVLSKRLEVDQINTIIASLISANIDPRYRLACIMHCKEMALPKRCVALYRDVIFTATAGDWLAWLRTAHVSAEGRKVYEAMAEWLRLGLVNPYLRGSK